MGEGGGGKRAKKRPLRVAFCFCGAFLREPQLPWPRLVVQRWEKAFSTNYIDAFVSTSTQHYEDNTNITVNRKQVEKDLIESGFSDSDVETERYNVSKFVVKYLPLRLKGSGLYPHRIASYFNSIARCLLQVKQAPTPYEATVVTRLDLFPLVSPRRYIQIKKQSLVSLRSGERFEDRLFFGASDIIDEFTLLESKTDALFAFFFEKPDNRKRSPQTASPTQMSSETMLFLFAKKFMPGIRLLYVENYINFRGFVPFIEKQSTEFHKHMISSMNYSVGKYDATWPCSDLAPGASVQCKQSQRLAVN